MALTVVDTSVWIGALSGARGHGQPLGRSSRPDQLPEWYTAVELEILLNRSEALVHPWVLGELALGGIGRQRGAALAYLQLQPRAPVVPDGAVLALIARHKWYGRGIGWVDAQLAASAVVAGAELWTHDRQLRAAAGSAGVVLTRFRVD
jgi:predicted nucleic acid-binding protein